MVDFKGVLVPDQIFRLIVDSGPVIRILRFKLLSGLYPDPSLYIKLLWIQQDYKKAPDSDPRLWVNKVLFLYVQEVSFSYN